MAKRNSIGIETNGLEDIIASLEKAELSVTDAIEQTLIESKKHVTNALVRDTVPANYPAKGKYSTGDLEKSINKDTTVMWRGLTAEIKVGYDFNKAGLVSVFMMYGTPRYMKVQKIYNDFYSSKTKRELEEIQQKKLNEILEKGR